jgi:hypothetical protein
MWENGRIEGGVSCTNGASAHWTAVPQYFSVSGAYSHKRHYGTRRH